MSINPDDIQNRNADWEKLPKKTREFSSFLSLIVDETLESGHEAFTPTYIHCFRKKCTGIIETAFDYTEDSVNWRCTNCERGGVITHIFGD